MKSVSHVTNLKHACSVNYSSTWMLCTVERSTTIFMVYNSVINET